MSKKVYIVVTVSDGMVDADVDQYMDIIGVYDTKESADEIKTKLNSKEQILGNPCRLLGLNYNLLNDYREAAVLEFGMNEHIKLDL